MISRRQFGDLPGQVPAVARPTDTGWNATEPTPLSASSPPPSKNNTNRPSRGRTPLLRLTLPFVSSSHAAVQSTGTRQGFSGRLAPAWISLRCLPASANIRYPITIMDDPTAPATKADIMGLEGRLDDLAHQVGILIENTHCESGSPIQTGTRMPDARYQRIEERIVRLEKPVGLSAA